MSFFLALITRVFWWALPKLASTAVDCFGIVLAMVERVQTEIPDPANRRAAVMAMFENTIGRIPQPVARFLIEFAVILVGLGVTSMQMEQMESIVAAIEPTVLSSGEKREEVLRNFGAIFPDLPERITRLLLEIAVAKIGGRA